MKIICIGRNYVDHAKELNNEVPEDPIIFMKPPSALLLDNQPFYYPEFSKDIHYEAEVVLKICKNGKHVQDQFAADYYDQIGFGIDFTARDLQSTLKKKGHPWEKAKAFDQSAVLGNFYSKDQFEGPFIEFKMEKNGVTVQDGTTKDLIFDFNFLIVYISQFFKLQVGDLIYTGTPAGVGPVEVGDKLDGYLKLKSGIQHVLSCEIK